MRLANLPITISFTRLFNQDIRGHAVRSDRTVPGMPELEFHVSRKARQKYQLEENFFTLRGNVIFANFYAAQLFAQKLNTARDVINHPDQSVSAAEINAMGLIHEIMHNLIDIYRQTRNGNVFNEALETLETSYSPEEVDKTLERFLDEFPPLTVYQEKVTLKAYLAGSTGGVDNRQIALEEMLMLWLSNQNKALARYSELFDDTPLRTDTIYVPAMNTLNEFFDTQPLFGPEGQGMNLIQALLLPASQNPDSLVDQLHYFRNVYGAQLSTLLNIKWDLLLGKGFMDIWGIPGQNFDTRLLRGADFITEETKNRFDPGSGQRPTDTLEFAGAEYEPEAFSPDTHWMPRLVLIAKSTLVWMDQLSRKYRREIKTLDQIPDEELDKLARWGFSGLWLIGIWERSTASKTIKRWCGNPEAESSAYSLYNYTIAHDLGGDAAYQKLREKAWQRGIRLASDMVPNHTGIVSKWIKEHPEWFISLPYPPFPGYTYSGHSLSDDPNIGIFLEDHYFDRSDAAVTFKRVDYRTGDTRYIYHGNDGTSMPWNDTAQLDYTRADVREAVIQMILEVARRFPIIRFDAAMTLAKRHYQRLWFPQPGSGGDIPSRAQQGLTRSDFDEKIPQEFWREVVDRVASEVPDTLLLAEAFWMMEGYFVRSLGMHRVYNSAFMNMLKNEENKKYRYTIKNTIEFEPEVLKRYVNFMNNPDEETAIHQFGDGDKYFGVCVMLSTMPGLPMFGHGQVEGLREKYGMEYRRAYHDEQPNNYLIERHQREIFPLLKKRHLFAEVDQFLLYDLYLADGSVNEDVFAYSNSYGEERSLVVFHNAYRETTGWIHTSAAYSEKVTDIPESPDDQKRLVQKTLGDGLSLPLGWEDFVIFRDSISGLEYIHSCQDLWRKGMYIELGAYKYRVFLNFRMVKDHDGQYRKLSESLQGRGVQDIDVALREQHLRPLHAAFDRALNSQTLRRLIELQSSGESPVTVLDGFEENYRNFIDSTRAFSDVQKDASRAARDVRDDLAALLAFNPATIRRGVKSVPRAASNALRIINTLWTEDHFAFLVLSGWLALRRLGERNGSGNTALRSSSLIDEWMLDKRLGSQLVRYGLSQDKAAGAMSLIKLMTGYPQPIGITGTAAKRAHTAAEYLFNSHYFQQFTGVNNFENILWFKQESFDTASRWLLLGESLTHYLDTRNSKNASAADETFLQMLGRLRPVTVLWEKAMATSEYQVAKFLSALETPAARSSKQPSKKKAVAPKDNVKSTTEKKGRKIKQPPSTQKPSTGRKKT